jgi:hypothetical protein
MPRKVVIAVAIIARLVRQPHGDQASWGRPLEEGGLASARNTFEEAVRQDRSLARHIARDLVLLFEANGGLTTANQVAAFEAVGLDPSSSFDATSGPPVQRIAAQALAVARTIQARSRGGEGTAPDLSVYRALYEDRSDEAQERAFAIGAWAAIVVARLASADRLSNGLLFFEPGREFIPEMEGIGWYPNPVNPGETATGEATIERWWDGDDWTDRVRFRDGRRWNEAEVTFFSTPGN